METTQLPDLRPQLLTAFEVADSLLKATTLEDLDKPTPCEEFDVRDLSGHLLTVVQRIRIVLTGGHFAEVEHITWVADRDFYTVWDEALERLRATLPGVDLSVLVTFPFGEVPGAAGVASYVCEVATHSWDLATAIGRTDLLDPALAELALPMALQRIPVQREGLPFGEAVPVADSAEVYDRLVAWMGRDPAWTSR
ncbi:TIGR03086 family metal-binding protein [Dermacoccaceae bacterium W4C1]